MTLQWTAIAFILYAEIAIVLALLFPWIRPQHWKKLFNSRLIHAISKFADVYSYAVVAVLLLLFLDAIREVRKYSDADLALETRRALENDSIVHMRLFRAQRNLYISGFALLLFLVIKRIVTLISRTAALQASADAALRQAEGAQRQAKTLMEASDVDESVKKLTEENEKLQKDVKKIQTDRDAMKKQTENLQEEYDRVCSLLNKAGGGKGDKKDD